MRLARTFLEHAGGAKKAFAGVQNLETILASMLELGRSTWPALAVTAEAFVRHLAEKSPEGEDPLSALQQIYVSDLYLATACAGGDSAALTAFENQFLTPACVFLGREAAQSGLVDEVKQTLRERLFVRNGDQAPKIASYSGQGPLAAWLRSAISRTSLNLRRTQKRAGALASAWSEAQPPREKPEIDFLKKHYKGDLEEALRATLSSLPKREANVLRLHFLQGMTMGSIAGLYRVSWHTIQRWVARARQHIFDETRRILAQRLEVSSSQLDTLLRFAEADLNLSLHRFLKKEDP